MRPEASLAIQISWLDGLEGGERLAVRLRSHLVGERAEALDVPVLAGPDHGRRIAGDELGRVLELPRGGRGLLVADAEADEERGRERRATSGGGEREAPLRGAAAPAAGAAARVDGGVEVGEDGVELGCGIA